MLQTVGQTKNNSNIRRQIDENLKRVYHETAAEEVPDRFVQLLQQLKERQGEGSHDDK